MIELKLKDITLGYRQKPVVRGINFEVKPGEMLGIVGANGCGKSTIIKAIARIIRPFSGSILLNGMDINQISKRDLSRLLGVVPQMPLLPSTFTAFEIVLMGRNPHLGLLQYESKKDMVVAWEAMEKTATQQLAERRIGQLSGGEIQSVVIARVLAQQTKSILLDEPTANLDIGRQIEILDLIKKLCENENLTVVIAIHELNLAAQYCDRMILVSEGRIHSQGEPHVVITEGNIKQVYGSSNCIVSHPLSGLPAVLPTTFNNTQEIEE
ncbi:MAG: ABC transporter ATP-binding protein [Dehalococcoidia bacterium]|nr:MAG: ABC transporter ATP-binding protein [Dehalococcoidia bacterium]